VEYTQVPAKLTLTSPISGMKKPGTNTGAHIGGHAILEFVTSCLFAKPLVQPKL
jgi:hypothetical protein